LQHRKKRALGRNLLPMALGAMGSSRNIIVVGKVVSGRTSRARNVLLNLDKQFPNEIFAVFIKKEALVNFGYEPVSFLKGKRIAVTVYSDESEPPFRSK